MVVKEVVRLVGRRVGGGCSVEGGAARGVEVGAGAGAGAAGSGEGGRGGGGWWQEEAVAAAREQGRPGVGARGPHHIPADAKGAKSRVRR